MCVGARAVVHVQCVGAYEACVACAKAGTASKTLTQTASRLPLARVSQIFFRDLGTFSDG
jgi:hypothetical protein